MSEYQLQEQRMFIFIMFSVISATL